MNRSSWIPLALSFVMAGLLASCGGDEPPSQVTPVRESSQPTPVFVGTAAMAVDAVSGGELDATRLATGEDPFEVDILIQSVDGGYQGYQYKLEWDPSILAYDEQEHLMPGDLNLCAQAVLGDSTVYSGCARVGGNTTFTGPLNTVTLHCVGTGTSPLHLKTMIEDIAFGTSAIGYEGVLVDTASTDASVTCE